MEMIERVLNSYKEGLYITNKEMDQAFEELEIIRAGFRNAVLDLAKGWGITIDPPKRQYHRKETKSGIEQSLPQGDKERESTW